VSSDTKISAFNTEARLGAAERSAFKILLAVSICHLLNDTVQSLLHLTSLRRIAGFPTKWAQDLEYLQNSSRLADFPLLIAVSEPKITSERPTICPEP
jgi:hypothetical protein